LSAVEPVEGEAVEVASAPVASQDLVPFAAGGGSIIRAEDPADIIAKATLIAGVLKDLIEGQDLSKSMGGSRKHVEVGAWQACGTMLGALGGQPLHAETVWTRIMRDPATGEAIRRTYTANVKRYHSKAKGGGLASETTYDVDGYDWEGCVAVKTPDGTVVGRAEAMCSRAEESWSRRDDYAVRSMAETRAESRAYRRAIGWIVHMAGYSPTPAEELGHTPGAPMAAPEWARDANESQVAQMRRAIAFMLGEDDPMNEPVADVLVALERDHGPGIAWIAARAIGHLAGAVKRQQEGTAAPAPAAAAPEPEPPADAAPEPVEGDGSAEDVPDADVVDDAAPSGPGPGTVEPPELIGQPVADAAALRAAGCTCPVPVAASSPERPMGAADDSCPIQGHGIRF
jgi:hypothetical protein